MPSSNRRREHRNQDLSELEALSLAGSRAFRVGTLVCCGISLLSSRLAGLMLYSPWVVYFSMMAAFQLVRFLRKKRKSDLPLSLLSFTMAAMSAAGLIGRLLEGRP